jgi:hypothetical protein
MMPLTQKLPAPLEYVRTPLRAGFDVPSHDIAGILEPLGTKLYTRERTLVQHVAWAVEYGLFELMNGRSAITITEAVAATLLSVRGADALLGVLAALGLAKRSAEGRYSLTRVSSDYFVRRSPYFVGNQLEPVGYPIPVLYLNRRIGLILRLKIRLLSRLPLLRYGTPLRIENQHARNLVAGAAAVRTGQFEKTQCIVDMAGGSGVFAIPLALEYPQTRVILTELPRALPNIRPILAAHGLDSRIELIGLDMFDFPWKIPECDGIFIGNFFHGFPEAICLRLCLEAFSRLSPGGTLWLHEMIWNDNRDGPLLTALWHAAMMGSGAGGQRTAAELIGILEQAGFVESQVVPTASGFALVAGRKPLHGVNDLPACIPRSEFSPSTVL